MRGSKHGNKRGRSNKKHEVLTNKEVFESGRAILTPTQKNFRFHRCPHIKNTSEIIKKGGAASEEKKEGEIGISPERMYMHIHYL